MYSLKSLGSSIGLILLTLFIALVGIESYNAYMVNHTYYYDMMSSFTNWRLIIGLIIISLLPIWIIFKKNIFSFKYLGWSIFLVIIISGFIHTSIKGGLVGSTGSVIFFFNTTILFILISIFLGGLYSIGSRIYKRYIKSELTSWSDILLSLGLGLGIFLLFNYILIFSQLFFWPLAWLQFIGFGYLIWSQKIVWKETGYIIGNEIQSLRKINTTQQLIITILLIITLVYILFGFNLSFIPYSTAWDANHAYMYYPKVWTLNNGLFFSEGPVTTPHLWMVYIAYWFSLFKPFGTSFSLAPDTVAVVLNNVSGWLSLFFGLGTLSTIINYFKEKQTIISDLQAQYTFNIGWMYFLLWLMSGMGAFLVFVDNKTDLGVMSLTMLAIMSGFLFIKSITNKNLEKFSRKLSANIPALLSAFFFGLAILSKPTAFQDVIIFFLFLIGTFIGLFGVIGIFFLVLAVLGKAEAMSMVFYVSKNLATKIGIIGLISSTTQVIISQKNKLWQIFKPILYRGLSITVFLFIIKGSYLITYQVINNSFSFTNIIKGVLLSHNKEKDNNSNFLALVADTGESNNLINENNTQIMNGDSRPGIKANQCTLSSAGLTQDNLYDNLGEIKGGGLTEDLGRYIGYGQRVFTHPSTRSTTEDKQYGSVRIGYYLLRLLFHTPGCYSLNTTAQQLCENPSGGQSGQDIQALMNTIDTDSNQYKFLQGIKDQYDELSQESDTIRKSSLSQEINQAIKSYVEGNVVQVSKDNYGKTVIAIPYAFLTPLNVIFNRSLQNLSSYYTDIGFIWILSLILLIAGTIYSIYNKQKELTTLHIVTIAGWIIWWFLASGIIWYAVGIIAWTTFCNAIVIGSILTKKSTPMYYWTSRILISVIIITALIQTLFNLTRIASQGSSGPFVWYKGSTGKEAVFIFSANGSFGQQEIIKYGYNAQDVFNLQFGHYNAFINHVKDRKNNDGVLIAGTYLQYFLDNQNNIYADGLLTSFWQWGSDEHTCNLNLRLQDKNIKYLVIDPNIGSVVMGEGNASLFDRFFAKIDSDTNSIINHGTMTMLVKMVEDGYLKLINTNNMGAKYAYTLSHDEIIQEIQGIPDETIQGYLLQSFQSDPILFKAKLAAPRFFTTETQYFFALIGSIFQSRLTQADGIYDMADILGKQVDAIKISKALSLVNTSQGKVNLAQLNTELNDDERTILGYYLAIQARSKNNDFQGTQEIINQLLQNSLAGGSQLITFERIY